jgi:predicted nucleic acid-binding Zn finger protein
LDKEVALAFIEKGICYALSDRIQYFDLQESEYKEIAYELMRHGRADAILRNMSKFT